MSLRRRLLIGILVANGTLVGFLAFTIRADVERRAEAGRRAEETFRASATGTLEELFLETFETLPEGGAVGVTRILEWPYWVHCRDALVLDQFVTLPGDVAEGTAPRVLPTRIYLNPLGRLDRPAGKTTEHAVELIARAMEEGRPIHEGDALATPIYLGQGSHRSLWGGAWLLFDVPALPSPRPFVTLQTLLLAAVAATLGLSGLVYLLLDRLLIRRIGTIEKASRRIARGQYRPLLPEPPHEDELSSLVRSINAMTRELQEIHENLEERVEVATERMREAERHLEVAQRLAASGRLAAGIAHEINNPLGGLLNAARTLRRRMEADGKASAYVDLILSGLGRIEETVQKFLRLAPRPMKPRPVSVAGAVREACDLCRHQAEREHVSLRVEGPGAGEDRIFGDPVEIQRVFLNLLLNALDAIQETGRGSGEIRIRFERDEEAIVAVVEDDGIGMSAQELSSAFDLFHTTKEEGRGSGLGLPLSHSIVERHGGTLRLASRKGRGTTARVRLPLDRRDARGPEGASPS